MEIVVKKDNQIKFELPENVKRKDIKFISVMLNYITQSYKYDYLIEDNILYWVSDDIKLECDDVLSITKMHPFNVDQPPICVMEKNMEKTWTNID